MDWFSLLLPLCYLTLLVASLATFSHLYRRRKATATAHLEPWFPPHLQRQVYLSLLELQANSSKQEVPDSLVKAALLRRATENIHRVLSLRQSKPALGQLLQRGSVGDELWQRFLMAEKEMEAELRECVEEANALANGWGQVLYQSAGECAQNEILRRKLRQVDNEDRRKEEREEWEARRGSIREDFMKELDGGPEKQKPSEVSTPDKKSTAEEKEMRKSGSSEEDAVIVDAESPESPAASQESTEDTSGGGSAKKKKKGKK